MGEEGRWAERKQTEAGVGLAHAGLVPRAPSHLLYL